jgi:hypothetical protein
MRTFPRLAEWQVVQDILRIINPNYVSPVAREEHRQKQAGNPAEREIAAQSIEREAAHYRQGFPVAGHGEPEPVNQPRPRQRQRF